MTTRKYPHEPHEGELRSEAADQASIKQVAALEGKIAELESAAAEAKDRYLRLGADFENFKKRARQDQVETIQHASAELINRLLPGLDDLHKALEHTPKGVDPSWLKGVELSVRKLEEALGAHGLEAINSVGTRFDPKVHEAVGHEESREHPEDTVVAELRRGYRIRDRVVRPALVKLARPPALPADDDSPDQA
ncbi:MAG TPA: nucleotide exchange factor GrpE [Candidatus Dormibacteraeota bacterium]|jgi:molecular chaperone GrpE|nr:nucleotide exchange factor GrpE [Candidatus Dormibacteraeota bacterium]